MVQQVRMTRSLFKATENREIAPLQTKSNVGLSTLVLCRVLAAALLLPENCPKPNRPITLSISILSNSSSTL